MNKILYNTNQNHPQVKEYKEAVERGKQSYHVLARGNEWIVKKAGSLRPTQVFGTQNEATDYAKSISQTQGTAVFIHGVDGRIEEKQDYSGRV